MYKIILADYLDLKDHIENEVFFTDGGLTMVREDDTGRTILVCSKCKRKIEYYSTLSRTESLNKWDGVGDYYMEPIEDEVQEIFCSDCNNSFQYPDHEMVEILDYNCADIYDNLIVQRRNLND